MSLTDRCPITKGRKLGSRRLPRRLSGTCGRPWLAAKQASDVCTFPNNRSMFNFLEQAGSSGQMVLLARGDGLGRKILAEMGSSNVSLVT